MKMAVEIWKPVAGYEGLYEVSNLGVVRTLHPRENCCTLKPYITPNGYEQVCLYSGNSRKKMYVHRIVATAFVDNPDNKPQVNHIDENKRNNSAVNLEWITIAQNLRHGSRMNRQKRTLIKNGKTNKKVDCYSISGEFIQTFNSCKEASKATGANASTITQCCKGAHWRKTSGGYVWKYHDGGVANGS